MKLQGFLKILDPTYGLYLHWKWERTGKGSLFDHLLCAIHASLALCLGFLALYYLTEILLISRELALIMNLTYGLAIPLIAGMRARRCRK